MFAWVKRRRASGSPPPPPAMVAVVADPVVRAGRASLDLRRVAAYFPVVTFLLVALALPAFAAPAPPPVAAVSPMPAPEGANDDDGPYVRYVGDGLEARWVCRGNVEIQRIAKAQWPQLLESRCGFDRALEIRGRATLDAPARITGAPRLVALSDTHGQYALVRRLLQANGIVDAQGRWSYGSGHLVMTGDVFDRGSQVNEILWLLYTLEQEAREVGGAVDFVLGNHESLVLRDDLRYVHDKYRRNAKRLGTAYPALYGPDTVLGDWLRSKRTVLQVDELLFVHGGLGPAFFELGLDLDEANARSRASLGLSREQLRADPVLAALQDGADSPIWYRGYFFDAAMTKARVQAMLQQVGAARVVVGHTSQPNVQSRFDGLVIAIDSSLKEGESGELLFREDGVLSRGLLDGSRVPVEAGATPPDELREETINTLLRAAPIIDGHDDFPIHYVSATPAWSLDAHDFAATMPGQVDVARLRAGRVGASLVTLGSDRGIDDGGHFPRVLVSFDWLDALVARYPQHLARATDVASLEQAQAVGRIALVPAIEAGDQIDGSLENLRDLHARGLRAMTLVYDHDNGLGKGANAFIGSMARPPVPEGLSPLGRDVVREMNCLGMMIDLSHAHSSTAREAIALSRAPVIFSHSNARALVDTERNVPDDVLRSLAKNGGIVMLTPVPYLTSADHWRWWDAGERQHAALVAAGDDAGAASGMADWEAANRPPAVTVAQFADMVEYAVAQAGEDHVGIGSDFDGMGGFAIAGLQDVSRLPALFVELSKRGWSEAKLRKLSRENFLRVWREVERVARESATQGG